MSPLSFAVYLDVADVPTLNAALTLQRLTAALDGTNPPASLAQLLEAFAPWFAQGRSAATARAYRCDLSQFLHWCQGRFVVAAVSEVRPYMLAHYWLVLDQAIWAREIAASTARRKLNTVHRALCWAEDQGLILSGDRPKAGYRHG